MNDDQQAAPQDVVASAMLNGPGALASGARADSASTELVPPLVEGFRFAVPEDQLTDLRGRLARTRWPAASPLPGWEQGVPLDAMRSLCDYWRDGYDWRRCEQMLNGWGQHRTIIDGVAIQFAHVRSPEPDALPLLLSHGWPQSIVEFHKVIGPLTDPRAHGGDPADAVHLIMPSLPGYGFSGKPTTPGWNATRVAAAWITLMERLGYGERWVAQGGDWGELVTMMIGAHRPAGLIGLHFSSLDLTPTLAEREQASPAERSHIEKARYYADRLSGYAKLQATKPQTIGYALSDSPVAQAAWIYERFQDWTDNDGSPETVLTRDEILDTIMMYWLPDDGASSAQFYYENADVVWSTIAVDVPMAFSLFPRDLTGSSRRWAESRFSNVVYWHEAPRGGHFPALEQPALFVEEVRAGLRSIRKIDTDDQEQ